MAAVKRWISIRHLFVDATDLSKPLFVYCIKEAGPECEKFEQGKSEKCASLPTTKELSGGKVLGRVTNEYYCKGILAISLVLSPSSAFITK